MTNCNDCRHLKIKDWCNRLEKYIKKKERDCDYFMPHQFHKRTKARSRKAGRQKRFARSKKRRGK